MRPSRIFGVALGSIALVAAGPSAAFAGEVTGTGGDTAGTSHANSICVYSGLNDNPTAAPPEGGRTQSYGQLVRQGLKAYLPSPGSYCNAHIYPYPPGPPPPE